MRPLFPIVAVLALSACVNEPVTTVDVHTGVSSSISKNYQANAGLLTNLNAKAFRSTKDGKQTFGIATRYLSSDLTGWAFLSEAWSFGTQFPYTVVNRNPICTSSGCTTIEDGEIVLTSEQFEAAAKTGIKFKLVGKNHSVEGEVPAAAFKEVLALK